MAKAKTMTIRIAAQDDFTRGFRKVQGTVNKANQEMQRSFKRTRFSVLNLRNAIIGLGSFEILKIMGTLEKGWIDVAKTTGLAGGELNKLKREIKELSIELKGVSIEGLQNIARVAGQLGVASEDITDFTRVVAMTTTVAEVTAEEAAVAFAQLANILNEPISRLETMASVVNELSNNSVATTRDILDLTQRMGGAAETLNLTTAEVFGLSAAMRNMGIPVEEGGTAMVQVMTKMLTKTEKFADASGIALSDFAILVQNKPIAAIKAFLLNLSRMDKFSRAKALEEIGFTGRKTAGTLMKLANGFGVVVEQVGRANEEIDKGTSILLEYETASKGLLAQQTSVSNSFKVLADDMGETFLPAVKGVLSGVLDSIKDFRELGGAIGELAARIAGFDTSPPLDNLSNVRLELTRLRGELKELEETGLVGSFLNATQIERVKGKINELILLEQDFIKVKRDADRIETQRLKNLKEVARAEAIIAAEEAKRRKILEEQKSSQEKVRKILFDTRIELIKTGATERELIGIKVAQLVAQGATNEQLVEYKNLLESINVLLLASKESEKNLRHEQQQSLIVNERRFAAIQNRGVLTGGGRGRGERGGLPETSDVFGELSGIGGGEQSEIEMISNELTTKLELLRAFEEQHSALVAQNADLRMAIAAKERDFKMQAMSQTFGATANMLQNIFIATGSSSKKLFKVMKAFSIAQAVMDTYAGFNRALASLPFPANLAAAATVLAAGLARVAQIKATQPGGGAISSGGVSTSGYTGGSTTAQPPPIRLEEKQRGPDIKIFIQNPLTEHIGTDVAEVIRNIISEGSERGIEYNVTVTSE